MAADPYRYFRAEARDIVEQLGRGILDLEKGPDPELLARLLRLAHTLKGAARVVKQREIADLSHAMEDVLAPLREAAGLAGRQTVDAVLGQIDAIARHVAALDAPAEGGTALASPEAAPSAAAPEPAPAQAGAPSSAPDEGAAAFRGDIADLDELLVGLVEAHGQAAGLGRSAGALGRARRLAEALSSQIGARAAGPGHGHGARKSQLLSDELLALLASLERSVQGAAESLDREISQVREAAERLRLVPPGGIFTALERSVRDAAQTLGRRAHFEGRGGEIRLDAQVLATLRPALLQLVGNAVAHGIEPEGERRAAGKPPLGRVSIGVSRRGRRVVFACRDDGRGVDVDAIRRVAIRRGLAAGRAGELDAEGLMRLALRGGFSTSFELTEVAGRGIGLDLVREAAERLGGEVGVRSERGRGTTVELVVPLSLASLEGLQVEAAGIPATIPLDAVRSALRLLPGDVARAPGGESLVWEGRVLPFLPLSRVLRGRAQRPGGAPSPRSAVVVESTDGLAAIGVERLAGTAAVVLRALPDLAPSSDVVAGAGLDAEGTPRIVLDPDGLVEAALRAGAPPAVAEATHPPILVIDDSLTTRMLEQSILESAGYEVDLATSGEEGLLKARARRYALFLVDVEMPGMDGFTFIERTRSEPVLSEIPAILVTSRASPEDRRRGEEVGARAYIVKSEFEQTELLERIRRLVA